MKFALVCICFSLLLCTSCKFKNSSSKPEHNDMNNFFIKSLHDIWLCDSVFHNQEQNNEQVFILEINLNKNSFIAFNSEAEITGFISLKNEYELNFSAINTSSPVSIKSNQWHEFINILYSIRTYKREKLRLVFYDISGRKVMSCKKID